MTTFDWRTNRWRRSPVWPEPESNDFVELTAQQLMDEYGETGCIVCGRGYTRASYIVPCNGSCGKAAHARCVHKSKWNPTEWLPMYYCSNPRCYNLYEQKRRQQMVDRVDVPRGRRIGAQIRGRLL